MPVRLVDSMVREPGGNSCTAALGRLTARLIPASGFVEPVEVTVLDTAAINALAGPRGRVVLFRGLINKAQRPDEVAGVLAHEFTHVAHRHPAQALLRRAGVSLLVTAIGGDVDGFADLAALLHSSRRAAAADVGAVVQLRTAHISPAGLATFFVCMHDEEPAKPKDATQHVVDRMTSFAATHAGDTEHASLVTSAVARQGDVRPALSAADWQALRTICR